MIIYQALADISNVKEIAIADTFSKRIHKRRIHEQLVGDCSWLLVNSTLYEYGKDTLGRFPRYITSGKWVYDIYLYN